MKSPWIEAMRLRTLPVGLSGAIAGLALARRGGADEIEWGWGALCLLFALLAQIASNFANEYFDARDGVDTELRTGPKRGVSLGLISPRAMLCATLATLGVACALGLLTLLRGGWLMLPCGLIIALGALAYSAGPYPLSRHRLGEVAVTLFYGVAPVCLTYYLQRGTLNGSVLVGSIGIGLAAAMVVLVNNYRDIDSDRAVGKNTLSTLVGQRGSAWLYFALGVMAASCLIYSGMTLAPVACIFIVMGGIGCVLLMRGLRPAQSTRLLAATAMLLFIYTIIACFL